MDNEAEIRKRKIYRVTFIGFVVNLRSRVSNWLRASSAAVPP